MLFPWKQFLLHSGIATLLAVTAVAVQDQVCYGNSSRLQRPCSHRLGCQPGASIFITQAVRGFKPTSSDCDVPHSSCQIDPSCCRHNTSSDCVEDYTQEAFTDLARDCWNYRRCSYRVEAADNEECGSNYKMGSGYSKVEYMCLPTSNIRNVTDSNVLRASSLALRYKPYDAPGSYVCLVEAADCSSHTANVLLTKSESTSYSGNCSSIRVHTEEWLPCDRWYATYALTTPFHVWKNVVDNEDDYQAWAVIHVTDSSTLSVQCKQEMSNVSLSRCLSTSTATTRETTSAVPTTQTTDSTTRPDTPVATTFPSSDGTGAGDTSSTSTVASGSSSDVTKGTMPQSAENSGSTAAVVGGVVGGVVVLLVVVALVAIVFFLKRRSATGKTFKGVAWFKGGNSGRSLNGNSGRAESHVTYARPTSLPVYENSAAAIIDEAGIRVDPDSDYNHLGQKPTPSASRDVTYGHLTDGSDATDYGYDHVTKGKPAVRSGDVINNVYNTAGPATGGSCDEDFYNTTSTAKNRPDVINNVYNTPSPAIEASPDVDYYNTADLPQRGCDVINNIYDIPK